MRLCAFAFLLLPLCLCAATNDLSGALQRGLFEEEANRNLDAAAQAYQAVSAQFDRDRKLAATAIFRLGEVYRKQGKTNEAVAQYERIVREFADEPTLATLSRQNLGALKQSPVLSDVPMLAGLREARTQDAALLERVKKLTLPEARQLLPTLVPDELLTKLLEQYQTTEAKHVEQAGIYAPDHPEMRALDNRLKKLDEQIQERIAGIIKALEIRLAATPPATGSVGLPTQSTPTDDEEKEIRRIQAMIQNSPDLINAPGEGGLTPLCQAARAGWLRVAQFLLHNGAAVNQQADVLAPLFQGGTPLHFAAAGGHRTMVELLLQQGADADLRDRKNGYTALHVAANKGFLGVAQALVAGKADVNAPSKNQSTPLHLTAVFGRASVAHCLIANGAKVNAQDGSGQTPLVLAASRGDLEILNQLLAAGANPNLSDSRGRTALMYAAEAGADEAVKRLLAAKADPNAASSESDGSLTALHLATSRGGRGSVRLLLESGAKPNVTALVGQPGVTPLMQAASRKDPELVSLLLKYKADPNLVDSRGDSALFNAVNNQSPEMVQALLAGGANPNTTYAGGHSVLILSVADRANKEVATALIEAKADVNAPDPAGKTPLHWAAQFNRKDFVELLIKAGADVNVRDKSGMTPLDLVKGKQPNSDAVAALLRQHGALDELPDFSSIRLARAGVPQKIVFRKDANGINRFTVLEALRNYYPKPYYTLTGGSPGAPPGRKPNNPTDLPFPDFSRLTIVRRTDRKVGEQWAIAGIEVNLLGGTNGFDRTKDVPLEFGDVVEIREREHALSEPAVGLTDEQDQQLMECLARKVTFLIKGQPNEVVIQGRADAAYLSSALQQEAVRRILRSSSDLTRIQVKRTDPETRQAKEFTVNAQEFVEGKKPLRDDLWLQEGDVIEVPDKP